MASKKNNGRRLKLRWLYFPVPAGRWLASPLSASPLISYLLSKRDYNTFYLASDNWSKNLPFYLRDLPKRSALKRNVGAQMSTLDGDTRGQDCSHPKIQCNRRTTQSAHGKPKPRNSFSLQLVIELLEKVIPSDRRIRSKGRLGIPRGQIKLAWSERKKE